MAQPFGHRSDKMIRMNAVAAAPTGLYALTNKCPGSCASGHGGFTLLHSTDLGRTWTGVSEVAHTDGTGSADLYATDDRHLWVVDGETVVDSADGGRTWSAAWPVPGGQPLSVAARDRLWLVAGDGRLYRSAPAGDLRPTPSSPAGIRTVTALGTDAAALLLDDGTWRETADGGAHWSTVAGPCSGSPGSLSAAPDGTRWAVCTSESTGRAVYPMSATVAWRTGPRADIYRTTDRTQWTDVARVSAPGGPVGFVAVDAGTALYFDGDEVDGLVEHLTRDGGRTWAAFPFEP